MDGSADMKDRQVSRKAGDDWATPENLYEKLNNEFHFDFDPCPLHSDFDGLSIEWGWVNFVNPPYTRSIKEAFVKRGVEMQKKGKTSVFLLPVSTSTELFHKVILPNATEIRFLYKRVKFVGYNTKGEKVENKTGQHDSMVVVFKGKTLPDGWEEQ
jgi:site-specific DNA-methyltransferase (adenine-specific)